MSQISSAARSSASVTGRTSCAMLPEARSSSTTSQVVPGSIRFEFGGVMTWPPFTMNTLLTEASVSIPSRSRIASMHPASSAIERSMQLPSSETDLMSARVQRKSCAVIAGRPFSTAAGDGVTSGLAITNTVGLMSLGKTWSRLNTPRVTCR